MAHEENPATPSESPATSVAAAAARVIGAEPGALEGLLRSSQATDRFDQFLNYPAADRDRWRDYAVLRLRTALLDPEQTIYVQESAFGPVMVAARVSAWDRDHFGFPLANVRVITAPEPFEAAPAIAELLATCLADLRAGGVKVASMRIHGDHLAMTHEAENAGFRYFESIVWLAREIGDATTGSPEVRAFRESDRDAAIDIATRNAYNRGHFHCDPRFDRARVDAMYGKWLETSLQNGEVVMVAETDGQLAGFFIARIDPMLSDALGRPYGRFHLYMMDAHIRGKGLGTALVDGGLHELRRRGVEVLESGYATKNHASAKVHVRNSFVTLYDENTFHLWL